MSKTRRRYVVELTKAQLEALIDLAGVPNKIECREIHEYTPNIIMNTGKVQNWMC